MINYLDDLNEVKVILDAGKVILCPTDTIWGLSCNALDHEAVKKIYTIKQRDPDKPFIILVESVHHLKDWIVDIHPRIETLIHYHKRPLSIIYKAGEKLPSYLTNRQGTVAIRVTKNEMLKELIQLVGQPIVSTSANIQNEKAPVNFEDISPLILGSVDYVFETGQNAKNKARSSQIITFDKEGEITFLR